MTKIPKGLTYTYATSYNIALKKARKAFNSRSDYVVLSIKRDKPTPSERYPKLCRWNIILKERQR